MANGTTFNVSRVVIKGEGANAKKFYNEVGKVVLHASGKSGVLFLHMFDGDFALFIKEPKKAGETPDAGGATE